MIMINVIYILSLLGALIPDKLWQRILFGLGTWVIGVTLLFVLLSIT